MTHREKPATKNLCSFKINNLYRLRAGKCCKCAGNEWRETLTCYWETRRIPVTDPAMQRRFAEMHRMVQANPELANQPLCPAAKQPGYFEAMAAFKAEWVGFCVALHDAYWSALYV